MPTEQQLALLISTYDLGHQPFALASPAAWLGAAGARVACNDLAVEPLDEAAVRTARLIAVHLPMHTATRLAGELSRYSARGRAYVGSIRRIIGANGLGALDGARLADGPRLTPSI